MTLFIALGRMKLLFSGDGVYDPKKPVQYKLINGGWLRLSEAIPFIHAYNIPRRANSRVRFSISSGKKINQSVNVVACVNVREEGLHNDDDEFGEFDDNSLSCFRGLVLDISYRGFLPSDVPYGAVMIEEDSVLSVQAYRPINIVCWRRAICLEFMEKADVLEYYDQTVNSPSGAFYIPAVLRVPHLLQVVKRKRIRNTLSRKNIFYRDGYICQYCSAINDLTIDHVLPVARGGKWVWDNLVTACARCNSKKGQKTLEEANMNLLKAPKAPKEYEILAIPLTSSTVRMLRMRKETPLEWRQYLSKSYLDS